MNEHLFGDSKLSLVDRAHELICSGAIITAVAIISSESKSKREAILTALEVAHRLDKVD